MSFRVHVSIAITGPEGLLMVRESKPDVHRQWNLPGGRLEHGEALRSAARREALEETGLDAMPTGLVGVYTALSSFDNHVLRFVFAGAADQHSAVAGDDILEVRWFSGEELAALDDSELAGSRMLRRILRDVAVGVRAQLELLDEDF
jgi:ADP-ribose pyrophosphatase YjhB (NUDIX family)